MNKMIKYYQNSNSHIMESVAFEFDVYHCYSPHMLECGWINKLFLMFVIGNQHTWPNHPEAHLSTQCAWRLSLQVSAVPCSVSFTAPLLSEAGIQSQATCIDLPLNSWLVHKQYDYELQAASGAISFHGVMVKKFISFQTKIFLLFFFFLGNRVSFFSTAFTILVKNLKVSLKPQVNKFWIWLFY